MSRLLENYSPGNHAKGRTRDNMILDAIQEWKVLDTDQVTHLFFRSQKNGRRIAQHRLLSLHRRGRLKRARDSFDTPYYYYIGKVDGQIAHRLGVNWMRIWLMSTLKSWEEYQFFHYEQDYGILRCDGFVGIRNKVTGKMRLFFLEYDHSPSNLFDKVSKYNTLYEQGPDAWWVEHTDRFPVIVVVSQDRAPSIQKKVEQENRNNLRFLVHSLSHVQRELNNG